MNNFLEIFNDELKKVKAEGNNVAVVEQHDYNNLY